MRHLHGGFHVAEGVARHHAAEEGYVQRYRAQLCSLHGRLQVLCLERFHVLGGRALVELGLYSRGDGVYVLGRVKYDLRSVVPLAVFLAVLVAEAAQLGKQKFYIFFADAHLFELLSHKFRQPARARSELFCSDIIFKELGLAPAALEALAGYSSARRAAEGAGFGRAGIVAVEVDGRIIFEHMYFVKHLYSPSSAAFASSCLTYIPRAHLRCTH